MQTDWRPRAHPRVVLRREQDDWAVLFDPDHNGGFGLGPVAIFVWERLDGRRTLPELVAAVRGAFAEVPPEVEGQIRGFLEHLERRGLLIS